MRKSIITNRFFLSWLTQVINTLRNLTVVVTFLVRKQKTSFSSTKKHLIQANCICYLRSIRDFLMYLEDQLFLIAECLLKRSLSFWTIIINLLCRIVYLTSYSQHILEKIKTIGIVPENAILVTADVVCLYPNIPPSSRFKSF